MDMPKYIDIYDGLKPLYETSKILGLVPFAYGKTLRNSKNTKFFRVTYSIIILAIITASFIISILYDIYYKYMNQSTTLILPLLSQLCSLFGETIVGLTLSYRGTLQNICKNLTLIDQILKSICINNFIKIIISMEILTVFVILAGVHILDISGRNISLFSIIQHGGLILASYINITIVLQFINSVWIIKKRFRILNEQLTTMINEKCVEEILINANQNVDISLQRNQENLSQISVRNRNNTTNYDHLKIHTLRVTHSLLYDLAGRLNSDFGLQILLDMLHSFITLIMSLYIALAAKNDPHIVDCDVSTSCTRVITNFCLAIICILKFLTVSISCDKATNEMKNTSEIMKKLLLPSHHEKEALNELQLFSQQINNNDYNFTANGFFAINLNLLIQVAASTTTYLVILIQM
ncbi:hypothetical protein L9F63_012558, partial [Diploptera punctata]